MTSPTGENTFRGLALPAQGEWEQVQQNSSNTMVTLTHSTANAGAFLAGRDSVSCRRALPVLLFITTIISNIRANFMKIIFY